MPVQMSCPHCGSPCRVADEHLGLTVRCARCQKTFTAQGSRPQTDVILASPSALKLDLGCATSPGRARKRNEDSFFLLHQAWSHLDIRREFALAVVADGMGGHEAGDRASLLAIRTTGALLTPLAADALAGKLDQQAVSAFPDRISRVLQEANRVIYRQAQTDPSCKGMGATIAVVVIWDNRAWIGHAGDCRVYHQRFDQIEQVTRDQTLVARMVELGQLSAEEARTHPARNEVAQALGRRPDLQPTSYQIALEETDWLIVACDGLQAHMDIVELQEELSQWNASAPGLAQHLVDLADRKGGSDNCTVLAVYCS
jgi:PPM family protein phosphatase